MDRLLRNDEKNDISLRMHNCIVDQDIKVNGIHTFKQASIPSAVIGATEVPNTSADPPQSPMNTSIGVFNWEVSTVGNPLASGADRTIILKNSRLQPNDILFFTSASISNGLVFSHDDVQAGQVQVGVRNTKDEALENVTVQVGYMIVRRDP